MADQFVELFGMQEIGWAFRYWLRYVKDNNIKFVPLLLEMLPGIGVLQLQTAIIKGALMMIR